ncbi:MAG: hypothetical protein Q8O81_07070 [Giesbergeria sp.]|nr:hypothetical protein [Giesbergeria sp.]
MAELVGHDARITTLQAARREVFPHVSDYTALDRWPDCGQRRAWQTCKRSRHLPLRKATHFVEIRKQLFHQRKRLRASAVATSRPRHARTTEIPIAAQHA